MILASASPQRLLILKDHGFDVEVHPAHIPEVMNPNETPEENAERIAIEKAKAVQKKFPNEVILAADTMVVSPNGEILGKPKNRKDAEKMIREKQGEMELVLTGFCILFPEGEDGHPHLQESGVEISKILFQDFSEEDVVLYLDSEEWRDVAGAIRIEGEKMRVMIKGFEGDLENIIGLPMNRVGPILKKILAQE